MQKWEYLNLWTQMDGNGILDKPIEKVHSINKQEVPNWKSGVAITDFLNSLGEQGWELINILPGMGGFQYTLKRPKD